MAVDADRPDLDPLSILTSIVVLYFLGETLNTMTLGGLALSVGILVDDSTVTIENTHRLRGEGMSLAVATLHGSAGIAIPTMVSTLAISCVFTSVVFLEGSAQFLFTPLGLAVVFAMLASYTLSRTLTPIVIGRASITATGLTAFSRGFTPASSAASSAFGRGTSGCSQSCSSGALSSRWSPRCCLCSEA